MPGTQETQPKNLKHTQLDHNPGPGSYQVSSFLRTGQKSNQKQSQSKRFKQYQTLAPGPGTYNQDINLHHSPNALLLSRTKQQKKNNAPGPGQYDPDYKKIIKSQSGYHLSKSKKEQIQPKYVKYMPGPGTYQIGKSTLLSKQHGAGFGIERKIQLDIDKKTPGPGQYNTQKYDKTIPSPPKITFGKSSRAFSHNSLAPGPGAYQTISSFNPSKTKGFSMSFKNASQKINSGPGPTSYNFQEIQKLKFKAPSFSISKSQRLKIQNQKNLMEVPGPQKYNTNISTFDNRGYVIGKQKRKDLAKQDKIPGPGSYQIKNQSFNPKFSMSKSTVNWIKPTTTPGPGNYDPKMEIIQNAQYHSIGVNKDRRKPFYDQKKGIPGPGEYSYSTSNKIGNSGFSVGHQKRDNSKVNIGPGPGNYDIQSMFRSEKSKSKLDSTDKSKSKR